MSRSGQDSHIYKELEMFLRTKNQNIKTSKRYINGHVKDV